MPECILLCYNGPHWTEVTVLSKRTFQPKVRRRHRVHGFLARMSSNAGRNILAARRAKCREKLTV